LYKENRNLVNFDGNVFILIQTLRIQIYQFKVCGLNCDRANRQRGKLKFTLKK